MFGSSFKIATVWGIPVKLHISLLFLMLFYAWRAAPGGRLAVLAMLLLVAAIFLSIALHELGHSFVALRKGCRVREITLMFIGGAAMMEEMPRRPRDEVQMALAGPLVSIALGLICWRAGAWLGSETSLAGFLLSQVGKVNLFLAGFNLLPSFPMDGGRVFRALLTPKLGRLRATYVAARTGKTLAVFGGLYGLYEGEMFLVVLAFFIFIAADGEYRMVLMQERGGPWGLFGGRPDGGARVSPPHLRVVPDEELDEDEVAVSPPPYRRGPASRTHLRHEDDDFPFFRR
jgi:Zn-dependent protease